MGAGTLAAMRGGLAKGGGLIVRHAPVLLGALLIVCLAVPPTIPLQIPAGLLLFAIATNRSLRLAAYGSAATVLTVAAHRTFWSGGASSGELISTAVFCSAASAFGSLQAQRRVATARERELLAHSAVAEERLRIARELHDAVGHDVALMIVQSQALGATAADPKVTATTDRIADLGRRTMRELHRTLKLLREDAETEPQPGLARIHQVLDGARSAGVDIEYAVSGIPRPLSPALDLSAFRIVQESVTNVVRHAAGAVATVTVTYGEDTLELSVADDGTAIAGDLSHGHGLIGMRERAALFGGTIDAGPRPGGGFAVRTVLPYEAA